MSDMKLTDKSFALELDSQDALAPFRKQFHIPDLAGEPIVYLCGHSLGLQPKNARQYVEAELSDWERHGVDAHFKGMHPWYSYHEWFAGPLSRLVGASPSEVV